MAFESSLRSDRDMGVEQNQRTALWALDRCDTDAQFATWAKTYGRPLIEKVGGPLNKMAPGAGAFTNGTRR